MQSSDGGDPSSASSSFKVNAVSHQEMEESTDSISLNGFEDDDGDANANAANVDPTEREGVALLRQIFPDETAEELRLLHRRRLSRNGGDVGGVERGTISTPPLSSDTPRHWSEHDVSSETENDTDNDYDGASALRRRILSERGFLGGHLALNSPLHPQLGRYPHHHLRPSYILPHDFLRLPPSVAVRRYEARAAGFDPSAAKGGRWRYQLVRELEERAVSQHERHSRDLLEGPDDDDSYDDDCAYLTRTAFRDAQGGFGISLCERDGRVVVYSVTEGRHRASSSTLSAAGNGTDIVPGDRLVGINGAALLETRIGEESLVRHAVSRIKASPDPVVLHFARPAVAGALRHIAAYASPRHRWAAAAAAAVAGAASPTSRTGTVITRDSAPSCEMQEHEPVYRSTPEIDAAKGTPLIHPFAAALRAGGVLPSYEQERETTLRLADMTDRVRHWEEASKNSFRFLSDGDDDEHDDEHDDDEAGHYYDLGHPLEGVRKALSVRILNSFADGSESAYCVWVHDAEAGMEFFSPVRYLRDFCDLRNATIQLCPSVANLPFPRMPFTLFGSPVRQETSREREVKCRTLESFVRSLCTLLYRETDAGIDEMAEIAVHVQSFLGCGSVAPDGDGAWASPTGRSASPAKDELRGALKRSVQLYTYRLFLLDGAAGAVRSFVDAFRDRGPNLDDLEGLEAQGRAVLKDRAMQDLLSVQSFLDWMQGMILEACQADFMSIASRDEYADLFHVASSGGAAARIKDASWLDPFVREAVREQVEIEVYVPLRGVASRWLVRGWRHEDMEVQFKIKELRRRRQHPLLYGISAPTPRAGNSDTEDDGRWSARASSILSDRVGGSTLPCVKLRAIVDAAREISRHFAAAAAAAPSKAAKPRPGNLGPSSDPWLLGADDFLPLFMHCVVQADIERPCALCVLLKTLCDPMNRMGEIGYYLASFEATIAHIQEFDLSAPTEPPHDATPRNVDNDENDVTSFLSVPLNASP